MSFGIPVRNGLGIGLLPSTTISTLRIGGRPALFLSFVNTTALDSRITFTRASTATFTGSNGLIQSAAINAPRFDYNPTTLAPRGLLIEEQRANLVTYSEQFDNAAWLKLAGGTASVPVVTANAGTAPDGTATADRVEMTLNGGTTTSDSANVAQAAAYPAGSVTLTIWMRSNTGSNQTILLVSGGAQIADSVKTVTPTWQRFSVTQTLTAGSSNSGLRLRGTFTGGTADILVWGAQLEAGAFATSYIPTVASTATRSADSAIMTGTNFSSWYTAAQGTFVVSADVGSVGSGDKYVLLVNDANGRVAYVSTASINTFDGTTVTSSGQSAVVNTPFKTATAWSGSTLSISAKGAAAVGGAFDGTMGTGTDLRIGMYIAGSTGAINGHIQQIAFYNTRLPNTTLRVLTA